MPEILPISEFPSKYTQECYNCRGVIHVGSTVVAGAVNYRTNDPVWMHPRCAQLQRLLFGTREVIDGTWRIARFEQKCKAGCARYIVPGEKLYRFWVWDDGLSWHYDVECHSCHRSKNGATVEIPA